MSLNYIYVYGIDFCYDEIKDILYNEEYKLISKEIKYPNLYNILEKLGFEIAKSYEDGEVTYVLGHDLTGKSLNYLKQMDVASINCIIRQMCDKYGLIYRQPVLIHKLKNDIGFDDKD